MVAMKMVGHGMNLIGILEEGALTTTSMIGPSELRQLME
jgi:hypothetical protein